MLMKLPQKGSEAWTNQQLDELDACADADERIVKADDKVGLFIESLLIERSYGKIWRQQVFGAHTKRKPGRPPRRARLMALACKNAVLDLERIRRIWKQHQIKRGTPTAMEIAAARNKIDTDTLMNFIKNHPKFSRSK